MKLKIDKEGFLSIERTGVGFVDQECPFQPREANCGHWCPLFGELESIADPRMLRFKICYTVFDHVEMTDERTAIRATK